MRVDRSLTAAEELLSALLDISKLDSGMYEPEPEVIHSATCSNNCDDVSSRWRPTTILNCGFARLPFHIFSDRNLLYRIIQNFLANAIRYTE